MPSAKIPKVLTLVLAKLDIQGMEEPALVKCCVILFTKLKGPFLYKRTKKNNNNNNNNNKYMKILKFRI